MMDRAVERQMVSLMSIRSHGSWYVHEMSPGERLMGGNEVVRPADAAYVQDEDALARTLDSMSGRVALLWTPPKGSVSQVVAVYDLQ